MDRTDLKVITIDEFFKLKEMFQGLKEDQELAWEIYKGNYQDDTTDLLMHKALMFKNRKKFADAVLFKEIPLIGKQQLYIYIEEQTMHSIYKTILDKIMKR